MPRKDYLLIGFLFLNILTGIGNGIFSIALPLYVVSIGAGLGQVGLVKGISGIGALLMVLPSGILIDNYGSRRLYVLGSIISAFTTAALIFFPSSGFVIAAMLIQGFSNSLRFTSLNALFFRRLKEIGMNKAGWYRGSLSIGLTFIGPFAGGLLTKYLEYNVIFCITAIITLVPSLLMLVVDNSKNQITEDRRRLREAFQLSEWKGFYEVFRQRSIRSTVLLEGISTACFSTFASFIVVFAVNNLGVDTQIASNYIIIEGTAYILAVFLLGGLLRKYSKKSLYITSSLIMSLGLMLIGSSSGQFSVILGVLLLGAGTGLLNILTFSNLGAVSAKKGKISSALSACTSLGMSVGPMVSGVIGELINYGAIFISYIPLILLLVLVTQLGNKEILEEHQ